MITRKILTALTLAASLAAFAGPSYAGMMPSPLASGTLSIDGVTSTHTATSISFSNPANLEVTSGSFSELGTCFLCVTMGTPFTSSSASSLSPFELYTATNNSDSVSFWVTSDTFAVNSDGSLSIDGAGTVDLTGYAPTYATFGLTTQGTGKTTFSLQTVPEPGTLALFGAGLLGCALVISRRRRARQS